MANEPPINPLSGDSLSRIMAASLPQNASQPVNSACDAIALAANASMVALEFRLVGLGEDHRIDVPSAENEPGQVSRLPAEWNAQAGSYAFRYKHRQSSMEYLIKVNRMGTKAVIMGMGLGDDRTFSFDLKLSDFISEGNLPLVHNSQGESSDVAAETERRLTDIFITNGRLSDFGSMMRVQLIQKLTPSLQKEGYEESHESTASTSSQGREAAPGRRDDRPRHDPLREDFDGPARPHPLHDPLAQPLRPRGPLPEPMPGFEDEFGFQQPPRGGVGGPGFGFPRLGDRDLYPQGLGPHDPLRGGIGPGLGGIGGGGMHPTFDDPLFAGQGQGGRNFDPHNPPGSRYDPVGPGLGRHPRGSGMGGRPPNPFGGFGGNDFI